jgi:hypothetical protein
MMDSIERMRRINDLTRELKQHGFAESSFDAIRQVNQIYGDDELDDHVKSGLIKNSVHDKMAKDENMVDNNNENSVYTDRKIAKVSDAVDVLTNKMNEIIKAINDLDARIAELKSKQDKLVAARIETRAEPRIEPRVEVKVEATVDEKPLQRESMQESRTASTTSNVEGHVHKDEYSTNQRTGNFQSQDVAIDKMFYFGKK